MGNAVGIKNGVQTQTHTTERAPAKVVYLDQARRSLRTLEPGQRRTGPRRHQAEPFDLKAGALNRLTPEARRAYRERVDSYARGLIKRAGDISQTEANKTEATIAFKHIRLAARMTSRKTTTGGFGLTFALDASLTLGAAVIGALCARPDLLSGSGYAVLAAAVALAVFAFVVREARQPA